MIYPNTVLDHGLEAAIQPRPRERDAGTNVLPSIFVQVQTSKQTLVYFLILRKSRFLPKQFYNINY